MNVRVLLAAFLTFLAFSLLATFAVAAPTNTTPPTFTGSSSQTGTMLLLADQGAWNSSDPPSLAFADQWQRCDSSGNACVSIPGATSDRYVLGSADVGNTVRLAVIGTDTSGSVTAASAATAVVTGAVNTGAPTVSGSAVDGQTLSATLGTWTGTAPITYTYQWQQCLYGGASCADIPGATAATFQLTSTQIAFGVRITVTATNVDGATTFPSAVTTNVLAIAPLNTVLPVVSGSAQQGTQLSTNVGSWSGSAATYGYAWQRCDGDGNNCVDIADANGSVYTPQTADVGGRVRSAVTATNNAGAVTAYSAPTMVVQAQAPVLTAAPTLFGTAQDGGTLTATTGTWDGTAPFTYAYQWQRCDGSGLNCANIQDATSSSHLLGAADATGTVRVQVTATNQVTSVDATSAAVAIGQQAPSFQAAPVISGTATEGETLTTSDGSWGGTAPFTYTYQWQRCDSNGGSCADIPGATAKTRVLLHDDINHQLRVQVTATNNAGSSSFYAPTVLVTAAPLPVNTALPTVDSAVQIGQTITATAGSWTSSTAVTYAYQWQRCDQAGGACVNIAGANVAAYLLAEADVGGTVRVQVTVTNLGGDTVAFSAPSARIVAIAPVNTVAPSVLGSATDGATLTAVLGTWTGTNPIGFSYQWQRCDSAGLNCVDINGAVSDSYQQQSLDVGVRVRVQLTASNTSGSVTVASAPTNVVAGVAPSNTALPVISGTVQDGSSLTVSYGEWSGTTPLTYTHQWQRCDTNASNCVNINGATTVAYSLTASDVNQTVKVNVTATNSVTSTTVAVVTATVAPAAPAVTAAPLLNGTAVEGSTLTATTGSWTGTAPVSYTYQWQRCALDSSGCINLPGATTASYLLQSPDAGAAVRVLVTAMNAAGQQTAPSLVASVSARAPVNISLPTVSGNVADGGTLTAHAGTWTGTDPMTFVYHWQRCDSDGLNCTDITAGSAYTLSSADIGATVRVRATATNMAAIVSATSAATVVVTATGPANTDSPTITGTLGNGETLMLRQGDWTGTAPLTYAYQWQRCDSGGGNCVDINGATGFTYSIDTVDVGHALRGRVTVTNVITTVSATTPATAAIGQAPGVSQAPSLSGAVHLGGTLTANPGTYTGFPTPTVAYQWQHCNANGVGCASVSGATSSHYLLGSSDEHYSLRVRVTATNTGGSVVAYSDASDPVQPDPPVSRQAPTLTGAAIVGDSLATDGGAWTGASHLDYAWQRCPSGGVCADIPGATGSSYLPATADVGAFLRVCVVASSPSGQVQRCSVSSAAVTAPVAEKPVLSGTVPLVEVDDQAGIASMTNHGSWNGADRYAYTWQRCTSSGGSSCSTLAGAIGSEYAVTTSDRGRWLRICVTASNSGGTTTACSDPLSINGAVSDPKTCRVLPKAVRAKTFKAGQQKGTVALLRPTQITAKTPLQAKLTFPAKKLKTVVFKLNGKTLSGKGATRKLTPAQLSTTNKQKLTVAVRPRTGKTVTVTLTFTTANCQNAA